MIASSFRHSTIIRKTVCLPIIIAWLILFGIYGIAQETPNAKNAKEFKTWKITITRSGGIVARFSRNSLDNNGNLYVGSRNGKDIVEKVDELTVRLIEGFLEELDLPSAKAKTVPGEKIYDGTYSSFTITLDGKDFKIQDSSFGSYSYLELTDEQQGTLNRIKVHLARTGAALFKDKSFLQQKSQMTKHGKFQILENYCW